MASRVLNGIVVSSTGCPDREEILCLVSELGGYIITIKLKNIFTPFNHSSDSFNR